MKRIMIVIVAAILVGILVTVMVQSCVETPSSAVTV